MPKLGSKVRMLKGAFEIWAVGLLVIVLAGIWGQSQFMAQLRYRHPPVWRRLGRPTMTMLSSEPQAIYRVISFVASAEYKDLADSKLTLYGTTLRYSVVGMIGWFAAAMLVVALYGEPA